ncbi:MAG: glycosyltransferase family 2 protein [Endomicrobia bacterium]|nr:glycosyltransferase family 2 protein [Endomicrobiia bacterium]MCL2798797.1 glycosyltransferase family 2 protein [Endomicrobiia bacterium]
MISNLSVVMITKNEENNIFKSLTAVKGLSNDIIVVDSCSTDNTVKIAENLGAKVYERQFDSFANQKNYALSLASNEWVLHIDADEFITAALSDEIKLNLAVAHADGFYVPRENYFLGRKMKHSGLAKEYRLRLAKKSKSKYVGGLIHEELVCEGKKEFLKCSFEHHPYPDLNKFFVKFDQYTTLSALKLFEKHRKFRILDITARPVIEFVKRYFVRLGLLDGIEGLIWAVTGMFYVFIKYVKLYELSKNKPNA